MRDRGYPTENYDQILADLSVEHAHTLSRFRDAHEISARADANGASTEDMRQAMINYRSLFQELVGVQGSEAGGYGADYETGGYEADARPGAGPGDVRVAGGIARDEQASSRHGGGRPRKTSRVAAALAQEVTSSGRSIS